MSEQKNKPLPEMSRKQFIIISLCALLGACAGFGLVVSTGADPYWSVLGGTVIATLCATSVLKVKL
jgi:hypothetical protein